MDPVTQGVLGAAAVAAVMGHRASSKLLVVGALGGMAADADVLIRSDTDPTVAWEYHRHFTHSLAFVPFGGALVGLPFALLERVPDRRVFLLLAAVIGYATHGLLDAFTTYGTLLWWPFSDYRVALSYVAIIDPVYTLGLAAGVFFSLRARSTGPARWALALTTLYLLFGGVQRGRALAQARAHAEIRDHDATRLEAFPGGPFHLVWRTVYVADGRFYVDAARTPWWGRASLRAGGNVEVLPDSLRGPTTRTDRALRVLRWFARDYVARSPADPGVIGDLRYSADVAGLVPMWGLRFHPGSKTPVERVIERGAGTSALSRRWRALQGE